MGISTKTNAKLIGGETFDFISGENSCYVEGGIYPSCTYDLKAVKSGSYFALDTNGNGTFDNSERIAIVSAGRGIILGSSQAIGEIDLD